ncbi:MAG: pyrroline-5-carboxylate reductase [Oscillospiraceae bacterium]|jgi:pyrroline-5-carboxylate reductase|nr:pyrroline-5-carboxylate reductase [Oscillospiraceae bacterium]
MMVPQRIGFVGLGSMAQALFKRWIAVGAVQAGDVYGYDPNVSLCGALRESLGINIVGDNSELALRCDALVLAVKPRYVEEALARLPLQLMVGDFSGKAVLSVVTGLTTAALAERLPGAMVARVMPNTPAMVGEGVFAVSREHTFSEELTGWMTRLLESCGRVFFVEESDLEAVTGLSGSGPAYGFVFIEAMADAGVRLGLPRATAYEMAAQTLAGAGRMALESGQIPAALKDAVCSPGGTTIEAVYALERGGFRAAVIDAVCASAAKAAALRG